MPYVSRDAEGKVTALFESAREGAAENLPATHPEVLAFLFREAGAGGLDGRFLASDLAFIRVIEDLVAALVERRTIAFTDLPAAAQDKLLERRSMRAYLSGVSGVFGDESEGKII